MKMQMFIQVKFRLSFVCLFSVVTFFCCHEVCSFTFYSATDGELSVVMTMSVFLSVCVFFSVCKHIFGTKCRLQWIVCGTKKSHKIDGSKWGECRVYHFVYKFNFTQWSPFSLDRPLQVQRLNNFLCWQLDSQTGGLHFHISQTRLQILMKLLRFKLTKW